MNKSKSIEKKVFDLFSIDSVLVNKMHNFVNNGDSENLIAIFDRLHAADIADFLEQVSKSERIKIIKMWGASVSGQVLSELDEHVRDELLEEIPSEYLVDAVKELQTDDLVYLIEDLVEPEQEKLLSALDQTERAAIERSLQYKEDTAGRLMQLEVVTAPEYWTVGNTIDFLRSSSNLPHYYYEIIIVSPLMHPIGVISLASLLSSVRKVSLKSIMRRDVKVIKANALKADVAYAFNQYRMVSAPVVDQYNRLIGLITIDDAMDALEDETEEDLKRLAGLGNEELSDSFVGITLARFPWLATNLITAVLASLVIAQFSDTIESIVALAILMPIVASMGGNAGTQTLTIAVRALATRDLTSENLKRVILREISVGLMNGFIFSIVVGSIGFIWYQSIWLGAVLGAAMICNMLVAGLAGILVPVGLSKLKIDPALSSGVFVTTVTDIVGLFAFLALASIFLL